MQDQCAGPVAWRAGDVPVSTRFQDPYYALENGLAEARHVFLAGNGLPGRFRPGFRVAELGFGTGLNFLATWAAWEKSGCAGALRFTSFEAYPMTRADMARALAAFPALAPWTARLLEAWQPDGGRQDLGSARLDIVAGDARACLPLWQGAADAWYLDGFAPARNPELWGAGLLRAVSDRTAPGGSFATYTAAGAVRRRLAEAGFSVRRLPGYGRKRHMSVGQLT